MFDVELIINWNKLIVSNCYFVFFLFLIKLVLSILLRLRIMACFLSSLSIIWTIRISQTTNNWIISFSLDVWFDFTISWNCHFFFSYYSENQVYSFTLVEVKNNGVLFFKLEHYLTNIYFTNDELNNVWCWVNYQLK